MYRTAVGAAVLVVAVVACSGSDDAPSGVGGAGTAGTGAVGTGGFGGSSGGSGGSTGGTAGEGTGGIGTAGTGGSGGGMGGTGGELQGGSGGDGATGGTGGAGGTGGTGGMAGTGGTGGVVLTPTYYIDSVDGDDAGDGRSPETAWRSHTMVESVTLAPGDVVGFRRGSQFSGPMVIADSGADGNPITLTTYGDGEPPRFTNPDDLDLNGNCLRISGDYVVVDGLYFHDTPPTENANRLDSIFLMGAVLIMEGADHNVIQNCTFMQCTKGIQSTGEYTLITNNYLDGPSHPLWIEPGASGAWGPMGIQLGIGNQEVSYNTIMNYLTLDSPYGSDGGAIELDDGRFHKDNFYIHHNHTIGNAGFLESSWTYDYNPHVQEVHNLRVAFNLNVDGQDWLYMWAPCHDCYFDNNTVIRNNGFGSSLNDGAYIDFAGINFRNNLFVYTSDAFQGPGAGGVVTETNWYLNYNNWSATHWDASQAGSGDPGLVGLDNDDYNLTSDSPLRGAGTNLDPQGYGVDLNGTPLPATGPWDIGAFQFR